ncbi:MAG: HAD-IA family hydrolase [Roseburia sp.]|nr:HAD-IA family hydrolase [Roseburia sp.]
MKKALIWDLDGTLLDSYGIIVASLKETMAELGVCTSEKEILNYVITYSVSAFINKMADELGIAPEEIAKRLSEIGGAQNLEIKPMPNAIEILQTVSELGVANYVYTHKGKSTKGILANLAMENFFGEVVTNRNGFARKPNPDAINYLVGKYQLDRENTYYVGDRSIDVECAVNAGIKSILFLAEGCCGKATGKEDFIVHDLMEIKEIICNRMM